MFVSKSYLQLHPHCTMSLEFDWSQKSLVVTPLTFILNFQLFEPLLCKFTESQRFSLVPSKSFEVPQLKRHYGLQFYGSCNFRIPMFLSQLHSIILVIMLQRHPTIAKWTLCIYIQKSQRMSSNLIHSKKISLNSW